MKTLPELEIISVGLKVLENFTLISKPLIIEYR
jgi:hypothetical protein